MRCIPSDECSRAREWVSLDLDGELSRFEEVLLNAHLRTCGACEAFQTVAVAATAELRGAPLQGPRRDVVVPRVRRLPVASLRSAAATLAVAAVGLGSISGTLVGSVPREAVAVPPNVERDTERLRERQRGELAAQVLERAAPLLKSWPSGRQPV